MRRGAWIVAVMLAGCEPEPQAVPPAGAECGAPAYAALVGQADSPGLRAQLPEDSRVIPAHGAISMDYRPGRLNLELDEQGRVVRIWCG
jgi:hypothetical protein